MCTENNTKVTEIFLLGFRDLEEAKFPFFVVSLLIYIVILCGNFLIIYLVTFNEHLQIPMFFFVKHLGLADFILTTNIIPMMLHVTLNGEISISLAYCIFQLHSSGVSGFVQCSLLAAMSYDRYLAICRPLHYNAIMSYKVCLQLVVGCWFVVFIFVTSGMILVYQIQFCGFNHIDHFYCDLGPVVALSTSDTTFLTLVVFITTIPMVFVPFLFIIVTYICILISILRISSKAGRKKAFSTCSSHLMVVCAYYGSLITVYSSPSTENSLNKKKFLSLLYIVFTPVINPIIYCWRNKEIRKTLNKYVHNNKHSMNK
ncbi:hypothetical protein GDO86_019252 [Hymenochirus boettgeri]|uniref:G-protein coupled receptors family 1 profile domain-containing protein n=1 Tax=Hymenochirus boettgeri TaxID=247094 RepID=A0A8T2IM29_9PIPI|nr:hypothetical protein GDO86_019252 [Hymenochirus boettgeri]